MCSRMIGRAVSALCVSLMFVACRDSDEARIAVTYRADAIVPRAQTTVSITAGRRRYVVEGAELLPVNGNVRYLPTPMSGEATVDIAMRDAQGAIATGQVVLPLKSDWEWGVDLWVDSVNPSRLCFGCFGSLSFPLRSGVRRSARDSLWVVWGGNSIRNPVVY